MIATTMFKKLLYKYGSADKERNFETIKQYENNIKNKISLNELNPSNYNRALQDSINIIEHQDTILSFVLQLSMIIKEKYEISKKELKLLELKTTREIESLSYIQEITTKTERQIIIKRELEEKLFSKNSENEDLKTDYEFAKYFVEDATRGRESAYAYYQAVKIAIPKN
jgi:putative peptidase M, neutral zinc metallopeptidase, zinc-binding site